MTKSQIKNTQNTYLNNQRIMKRFILILVILVSCKTEHKELIKKRVKVKPETISIKDTSQVIKSLLIKSEELARNRKINDARENINQAIKLCKETNNKLETANALFLLSKLEYKYGVPQIAELSFEKAKEIYKSKDMKMKIIELNTFGLELYKYLEKKEKVNEIINNPLSE